MHGHVFVMFLRTLASKTDGALQEISYIYVSIYVHRNLHSTHEKVQVGKDQEKAQSERDSHSKNRGGKKQTNNQALIP